MGRPARRPLFARTSNDRPIGWKRRELTGGKLGTFKEFVDTDLIPHLRGLRNRPDATPRQKIIGEVMTAVERVRIDTDTNLLNVLDRVHVFTSMNAARAVLGHSSPVVTEVDAELDSMKAAEVMERVG